MSRPLLMRLAFIDTETTGTDERHHDVWEIAIVVDDGGVVVFEESWMLTPDIQAADARALEVGGFYERIQTGKAYAPLFVVGEVMHRTIETMVASCNVSFDTRFVTKLLHQHGRTPAWHYSPLDVKSFALGALMRVGVDVAPGVKTAEIASMLGLRQPEPHNALTDAHLSRAIYHKALTVNSTLDGRAEIDPLVSVPEDIPIDLEDIGV